MRPSSNQMKAKRETHPVMQLEPGPGVKMADVCYLSHYRGWKIPHSFLGSLVYVRGSRPAREPARELRYSPRKRVVVLECGLNS